MRPKFQAAVDDFCLGCGACALKCPTGALRLWPRPQRVYHPEDSFERVLMQSLERGTLHNLFSRPVRFGLQPVSLARRQTLFRTLQNRDISAGNTRWWAQVDSNHRPCAYQAHALTT